MELIRKNPLLSYLFMAFLFSWSILVPAAFGSHGYIPFNPGMAISILMGYGPTIAALIVVYALYGKKGIIKILKRVIQWRVNWKWYLIWPLALAVMIYLYFFVAYFVKNIPLPEDLFSPMLIPALLINIVVLGVINGEEIGWRGFALPWLQTRYSALNASLILGTIEGLFHLPLFFSKGSAQSSMPFIAFMLLSIFIAIIFTWIFNHTKGSILLMYIAHASQNAWTNILPVPSNGWGFWFIIFLLGIIAFGLVRYFGAKDLSRDHYRVDKEVLEPSLNL